VPPASEQSQKNVGYQADTCKILPAAQGRQVHCTGHVKLWRDDLSLACEKLTADFDKDGALKTARCTGAVKIVSSQVNATAADARFDNATHQAVLTGKPRAQQLGGVVEGKVITVDIKTNEVSVEGDVKGVIAGAAATVPGGGPK